MEWMMIATDSTAAGASTESGERSMTFMLALFLGVIQVGWLGLLLWVVYQVVRAI
jgi:cytoskeletal protein RodZ